MLASGSWDKTVCLWELATFQEICRFSGRQGLVYSVVFSPDSRALISGSSDTTTLIWNLENAVIARGNSHESEVRPLQDKDLSPSANLHSAHLKLDDLKSLWDDLAGDDTQAAYRAIFALAHAPEDTVPFLGLRLHPTFPADRRRVSKLIEKLGSDKFDTQSAAQNELESMADLAAPLMENASEKATPQAKARIAEFLENVRRLALPPENLRALRAVQALEMIGNADARAVLSRLANGASNSRITREAKSSLERLSR
jgi:hypothetical protein